MILQAEPRRDQVFAASDQRPQRLHLLGFDVHGLVPAGAGDLRQPARVVPIGLDALSFQCGVGMAGVDADDRPRWAQAMVEEGTQLAGLKHDALDVPFLAILAQPAVQGIHFR